MSLVTTLDVPVYFVKSKKGIRGAKEAFDKLESHYDPK